MITRNPTTLVANELELQYFIDNIMPELERDEVYFLSLSARNKYLTAEERVEFDLGRTEMFSRQVAYDKDGIIMALSRMEADLAIRTTRGGKDIPHKCLVTYINIHPSSTLKAYTAFKNQLDSHYNETFMAVMNGKTANYEPFLRSRTHMMNHIQRSTSRKLWIDIDIDSEDRTAADSITEHLLVHDIRFATVYTQGGIHLLVNKESLSVASKASNAVQLWKYIKNVNDELKASGGEAKFNDNAMVPLPGTYQAGKMVTISKIKE